jgi:hypothetical protein
MSKELIFKGLVELRELAAKTAQESNVMREKRDFTQVAKVLDNTLFKLGYRKPRPVNAVAVANPSANVFIERKEAKEKAEAIAVKEEINKDKLLELAKKEQVRNLTGGKKKNATKKQAEQIKALYTAGTPIAKISDDLNLLEDTIYNVLGIDKNDTGVILATNVEE